MNLNLINLKKSLLIVFIYEHSNSKNGANTSVDWSPFSIVFWIRWLIISFKYEVTQRHKHIAPEWAQRNEYAAYSRYIKYTLTEPFFLLHIYIYKLYFVSSAETKKYTDQIPLAKIKQWHITDDCRWMNYIYIPRFIYTKMIRSFVPGFDTRIRYRLT